jgi:putative transposase
MSGSKERTSLCMANPLSCSISGEISEDALDAEVIKIITETAGGIEERNDIEMERIGCDKDQIHLLCSAHPKIAPGQKVRVFKSITAKEIFQRKPAVKRDLWGGEF